MGSCINAGEQALGSAVQRKGKSPRNADELPSPESSENPTEVWGGDEVWKEVI